MKHIYTSNFTITNFESSPFLPTIFCQLLDNKFEYYILPFFVLGKLNSLEEFRSQRDDLMKKFEEQEKKVTSQEKRHTREMYEIERKFIISKDKLKKDMEARLLQLSTEFHDASELRIAATTHRVIRENIAVNNELDNMLQTHQKLFRDYNNLKTKEMTLSHETELHEIEKKKALAKSRVQVKLIDKITSRNALLEKDMKKYKHYESDAREVRREIKKELERNTMLEHKIRILEQNLHKIKCENTGLETDISYLKAENERLNDLILEGVSCIKEALTIKSESDISIRSSKRESLLNALFNLLSKGHERKAKKPSLETVTSADATYALGDLGFVPKPIEPRPIGKTRRNITSQTGDSFEEYLKYGDTSKFFVKKSYVDRADSDLHLSSQEDEEAALEEEIVGEEKSVLFYDSVEATEEETEGESADIDPFAEVGSEMHIDDAQASELNIDEK